MIGKGRRVHMAEFRIDFRFGLNRLLSMAYDAGLNPESGDVIVFGGRNRKKLKLVHADATGIWLSIKLFTSEEARCRIPFLTDGTVREISHDEFMEFISGCDSVVK